MYQYTEHGIFRQTTKGEPEMLCNFTAKIIRETRYIDGRTASVVLTITGSQYDEDLPPYDVPFEKFPGMQWINEAWGMGVIIYPVGSAKDELRAAIQMNSPDIERTTIYTHTGWFQEMYLHAGGAITRDGQQDDVRVEMPAELMKYDLPDIRGIPIKTIRNAVKASIDLRQLTPNHDMWPLIAATWRAPIGPADFAIHLEGRTGTYKSEISALIQSHWGVKMDGRNLPGSWSSTANALEAQAYRAKNAIFVIDDWVPAGTAWQQKAQAKAADQIFRAQGNQAGRARMRDTSDLQTTMYPRGIILSSGEDTPPGHSVRGRMLIVQLSPDQVLLPHLTLCQKRRPMYGIAMSAFIQWLATDHEAIADTTRAVAETIRDKNLSVGHARTPSTLGQLVAAVDVFLTFAQSIKAITAAQSIEIANDATKVLNQQAAQQKQFLITADPITTFVTTIRSALENQTIHLRMLNGGIPEQCTLLGWSTESTNGQMAQFTAHGDKIGWLDASDNTCYLLAENTYSLARKQSGGVIAVSQPTLWKLLKEAGIITKTDTARQRNKIRVTAEGSRRTVIAVDLATLVGNDDEDTNTTTDF